MDGGMAGCIDRDAQYKKMIILFARCHANKGTLVIPCPLEIALRPHKMQLSR